MPVTLFLPLTLAAADCVSPVVTNLNDVFALSHEQLRLGRAFRFEGQVLIKNPDMLILQTATGAEMIADANALRSAYREGDVVIVSGHVRGRRRYTGESLCATNVVVTGRRPLPVPVDMSSVRIHDPDSTYRFVRVHGILDSITPQDLGSSWHWVTVRTPSGTIGVSIKTTEYKADELARLVNAEVVICGIVVRTWGTPRSFGAHVSLRSRSNLKVLAPAPDDPFANATRTALDFLRRQCLSGTVEGVGRHMFSLVGDRRRRQIVFPAKGQPTPPSGSCVTIAGFEEPNPHFCTFKSALVRINSPPKKKPDEPSPLSDFHLTRGYGQLDIVRLRGRVTSVMHEGDVLSEFVVVHPKITIAVDVSAVAQSLAEVPEIGAETEVAGAFVCEHEQPTPSDAFPKLRRYLLLPRTADDIRVISRPSHWINARVATLALALSGVIVLFAVLSFLLRRIAERRGRALFDEHAARLKAETKVEERTHLAVELHDALSQTLTGIALQVDSAVRANRGENRLVARFLDMSASMIASCRKELQSCLWELRTRTFAEKDMTEAVRKTIEPYTQAVSVQIRFNVPRERFSEMSAHAILKIIRELVANAIRHGRAKTVRIAGESHEDVVSFSVRDDGCGFDPKGASGPASGHFGLQGIRERLRSFGGTISVESAPGRGTDISVMMKINPPDDHE